MAVSEIVIPFARPSREAIFDVAEKVEKAFAHKAKPE
jgi:hypothetical protein